MEQAVWNGCIWATGYFTSICLEMFGDPLQIQGTVIQYISVTRCGGSPCNLMAIISDGPRNIVFKPLHRYTGKRHRLHVQQRLIKEASNGLTIWLQHDDGNYYHDHSHHSSSDAYNYFINGLKYKRWFCLEPFTNGVIRYKTTLLPTILDERCEIQETRDFTWKLSFCEPSSF